MATDESASGRHAEFIIIDDPVRPNDGCVGPEDFMGNTFGVPRMRSVIAKIKAVGEASQEFARQHAVYVAGLRKTLREWPDLFPPDDEGDTPTIVGAGE